MLASPPTVTLVDAHNYIHRAFHGVPAMYSPDGLPTGATYGFARTLIRVLNERKPHYAAALFEGRRSFRRELFPEYKANRQEAPSELQEQFDYARQMAEGLGFVCLEAEGFEADDVMGTLARRCGAEGMHVTLVSGDKDLAQLVEDRVSLFDVAKNRELDATGVHEKFGVPPSLIPDYLALIGDSVDNIPGVPGVGPKTAVALLQHVGSLDALIDDLDQVDAVAIRGRDAVKRKIADGVEQLRLSRELATIRTDVPLEIGLGHLRYAGALHARLDPLFDDLGFGERIRNEIELWADGAPARPSGKRAARRAPIVETGKLDL